MDAEAREMHAQLGPRAGLARACEVRGRSPAGAVLVETSGGEQEARLALVGSYVPQAGDRVLVVAGEAGELYVIGVLRALRPADLLAETSSGTRITREQLDERSAIVVRSPAGRVVVEHHEDGGRTIVHGASGGVEVTAHEGPFILTSDEVRVDARRGVSVRSGERVKFETVTAQTITRLTLDPASAHLNSETVEIEGRSVRVAAKSLLRLAAEVVHTHASTLRQRADAAEVDIGQLVERARETYREVQELAQTRAGELRLVAEESFRALAKHTLLKAREDLKLRAEKNIYLD